MADLGQAFDSGGHEDMNSGFDPIPAGTYLARVVESDVLENKKKNGKYIKLKFEIMDTEFKGRFVWTNLNIINPSVQAVEIAQKELATLCRACGKGVIQNTDVLHGIPIKMKIKIKPAKGDYPAGNEPIGYASATVSANIEQAGKAAEEMNNPGSESTEAPDDDGIPWGSQG